MEFQREHRDSCQKGLKFREIIGFYNRKCDICKKRLWIYCVGPASGIPTYSESYNQAFEYLTKMAGYDEGYTLVCGQCWDQKFGDYTYIDI
jgi:hypothetical protein